MKIYKLIIDGGAENGEPPIYSHKIHFDRYECYYKDKSSAEAIRDYICEMLKGGTRTIQLDNNKYILPYINDPYDIIKDEDGDIEIRWNAGYASLYIEIDEIEVY